MAAACLAGRSGGRTVFFVLTKGPGFKYCAPVRGHGGRMASLASSARALELLGFFLLVDMLIASSAW